MTDAMTSPVATNRNPDPEPVGISAEWDDFTMSDAVWLLQRELDAEVIEHVD